MLLKTRSKEKGLVCLTLNRAQRVYARACTKRNIVLQARQRDYQLCRGTILFADDHATGNDDGAGGAHARIWPRDLEDCAHACGAPRTRTFARLSFQVSTASTGLQRRTKTPSAGSPSIICVFVGGPLVPRRDGGAGGAAGGSSDGGRHRAGVDSERGRRDFLRRVAASGRDGVHATLLPWWFGEDYEKPPEKLLLLPLTDEEERLSQRMD
jgi:hypothetical protein